eukprot:13972736-Ditylum_brightwellii.AAC.2
MARPEKVLDGRAHPQSAVGVGRNMSSQRRVSKRPMVAALALAWGGTLGLDQMWQESAKLVGEEAGGKPCHQFVLGMLDVLQKFCKKDDNTELWKIRRDLPVPPASLIMATSMRI